MPECEREGCTSVANVLWSAPDGKQVCNACLGSSRSRLVLMHMPNCECDDCWYRNQRQRPRLFRYRPRRIKPMLHSPGRHYLNFWQRARAHGWDGVNPYA